MTPWVMRFITSDDQPDQGMNHRQVFVKVNAPVDEDIAVLVTAMSSFNGLVTIDSCQKDRRSGEAYVSFHFGKNDNQLTNFLQYLSVGLGKRIDLCCGFVLRMEWFAGGETPIAQIRVAPKEIRHVAAAIKILAKDRIGITLDRSDLR